MNNRSSQLLNAVSSDLCKVSQYGPLGCTEIPPGIGYKQFVSSYLEKEIIRKYIPSDSTKQDQVAKDRFLQSNEDCKNWELRLERLMDDYLIGNFQYEIDHFFFPRGDLLFSSYIQILDRARTGPGSSVGAKGQSMYAKLFASPLTTTRQTLYTMYKAYARLFTQFSEAELIRYTEYGDASYVNGSRSRFVPKTDTTSRMICVEPSLNMFFQLGLGQLMEERLRSIGIDLSVQPEVNRRLAQLGSKTGSFATIDLSSASDSISLKMCARFLPQYLYDTLLELRSPFTTIDDKRVELNMISTMGNGFTFPLQTVIFSCVIRAAFRTAGFEPGSAGEDWSVFGDDLICPKKIFGQVCRLLKLLGFTVNSSKTFHEGPFRESCGADWFYGQPARPIYVKSLDSPQDILVAINSLNAWSAYTGIQLPQAVTYLIGLLPYKYRFTVPFEWNVDSGIRVPLRFASAKNDSNGSKVFTHFIPKASFLRIGDGSIHGAKRVRELLYNPAGLYCSFLYGELSNYKISVRHDRTRYSTKRSCTPRWDYMPADSLINGVRLSWQQWETAVRLNCRIL